MDLKLIRLYSGPDGVLSTLRDLKGNEVAAVIEHSYKDGEGPWQAKMPAGVYSCRWGLHRLLGMTQDFATFEVMGVPNHKGILFHCGNFEKDSEGCLLLGISVQTVGGQIEVIDSRVAFKKFMDNQAGIASFTLTVVDQ